MVIFPSPAEGSIKPAAAGVQALTMNSPGSAWTPVLADLSQLISSEGKIRSLNQRGILSIELVQNIGQVNLASHRSDMTPMAMESISIRRRAVRDFPPAYFALVMATGMLSIACNQEGLLRLSWVFLLIATAALLVLAGITLLRLVWFPRSAYHDFRDHNRGVGFFTIIAGVTVLGSALHTITTLFTLPYALWILGMSLWGLLTYSIFAAFIMKRNKPPLRSGLNGGWLLAVVATDSVALLTLVLLPDLRSHVATMLFLALAFWLCGGMLYIWMISLLFYRYTFYVHLPSDVLPWYWVDMGAMAMATVVGDLLLQRIHGSPFDDLMPFIKGLTIMFWATATWWIPMLLIFSVWRHWVTPGPPVYSPSYWSIVFPLAMYAVATDRIAELSEIVFLHVFSRILVYVAIALWALIGLGMVRAIIKLWSSKAQNIC
jgi:tellurite resistance protein TehA-like permease